MWEGHFTTTHIESYWPHVSLWHMDQAGGRGGKLGCFRGWRRQLFCPSVIGVVARSLAREVCVMQRGMSQVTCRGWFIA